MDNLLVNPTTGRRFNPRRDQYLKSKNPDKAPNIRHEEELQRQICHFLKLQYPRVMFRSDTSSGRWEYAKRDLASKVIFNSSRAWPDLFIYEPMSIKGVQYAGLAMELKKAGTPIVIKVGPRKGHLTSDPHIREQVLLLKELKRRGYYVAIVAGFDDAIKTINYYFGKTKPDPQPGSIF